MNCAEGCKSAWPSKVCLIGGGPSLRGFDFTRLRSYWTVAINDAALYLPWASALFSLDARWIARRIDSIAAFAGEKYLAAPESLVHDIPGVVCLKRIREPGLSEDPASVHLGGSSGYGALNLAYTRGAREIFLFGYDYRTDAHWHEGYSWRSDADCNRYALWAASFQSTVPQLDRAGVKVWNANPGSLVDAFPRITLMEALSRLEGNNGVEL